MRLLREGQYPPLRGATFTVDDVRYLYTTGFIPALNAFPHGHVPSPLQVADYIGDTSLTKILEEILLDLRQTHDLCSSNPQACSNHLYQRFYGMLHTADILCEDMPTAVWPLIEALSRQSTKLGEVLNIF